MTFDLHQDHQQPWTQYGIPTYQELNIVKAQYGELKAS